MFYLILLKNGDSQEVGRNGLQSSSTEASVHTSSLRSANGFAVLLHSRRHSLPTRLGLGQGVLVAESTPPSDSDQRGRGHLLNDGTGIIELGIPDHFLERRWEPGTYVMVVGALAFLEPFIHPVIKVHKIVDLSACPNQEAMWYLEVMEAFKLFYQPIFKTDAT